MSPPRDRSSHTRRVHPFDAVTRGRALVEAGADVNELLMELRLDGTNVIDCIVVVRELYGLSLGEAKRTVLASPAFADERERFEPYHDEPYHEEPYHEEPYLDGPYHDGPNGDQPAKAGETPDRPAKAGERTDRRRRPRRSPRTAR